MLQRGRTDVREPRCFGIRDLLNVGHYLSRIYEHKQGQNRRLRAREPHFNTSWAQARKMKTRNRPAAASSFMQRANCRDFEKVDLSIPKRCRSYSLRRLM